MESLVTLSGCRYLGGRAESAPAVRKGESSRITMADAAVRESEDGEDLAALQEETSSCPCMPHLSYSASELGTRYPPLVAPPDDGLDDTSEDKRDGLYQHGLEIAAEIRAAVAVEGRRRKPGGGHGAGTPPANTTVPHRLAQSESEGPSSAQSNAGQDLVANVEAYLENVHPWSYCAGGDDSGSV